MKYVIMLAIVVGLALADFVTGLIKAAIAHDVSSQKMRVGGLHKVMEIIVMATACGLEIGIRELGHFYDEPKLAAVTGAFAAGAVFVYIVAMEIISILENYVEANPEAKWAAGIVKKLRVFQQREAEKEDQDVHSEGKTE
jgi:phage-related holin